jgi:hypothetical protein
MCKTHHREYVREHYKANKKYYVDKAANWRDMQRATVQQIKEESPCADCKLNYPYYVMDFDHLSDKSFNISQMYGKVSLEMLLAEIAKCDIVCSNCHRFRTHKRAKV